MKKKLLIKVPQTVSTNILPFSIEVTGKLGKLSLSKYEQFNIVKSDNNIICSLIINNVGKKQSSFLMKEYLKFITNLRTLLKGVSNGFFIELKLVGVGYRFLSYKDHELLMKIGFCNNAVFKIPKEVVVFIENPTKITLFSIDYSLVKQTAASLRGYRQPDSYKGKGFQYLSEILMLKEVKKNG